MKKFRKFNISAISLLLAILLAFGTLLCGCGTNDDGNGNGDGDGDGSETGGSNNNGNIFDRVNGTDGADVLEGIVVGATVEIEKIDVEDAFSKKDSDCGYDEKTAEKIDLSDGLSDMVSDKVTVSGNTVTIKDEGEYIISGSLSNGQIIVDAEKSDKIKIVLNGVEIHSASSAAIYVKKADKVFVTLADGSENILSTDGEYVNIDENNIDAAIFSKDDITFNGNGSLTVSSASGHGIVSKDDVKFTGGEYVINSASHGISGKDRVYISNGKYSITSGKDCIHSSNSSDETLGNILILGGELTLVSTGDGIDGGNIVQIEGGDISVISGGGAESAGKANSDSDDISDKGIKADGAIVVNGGNITLNTADDGLHAGGAIEINGGTFNIRTGDDGIHSDSEVNIFNGEIEISESYEGIEGVKVNIDGGKINVVASDDGINAAGDISSQAEAVSIGFGGGRGDRGDRGDMGGFGGGMMDGSNEYGISISGGYIYINAEGDGIDSNGFLVVSGGETYVDGPVSSANGALDYGTGAQITGGIVVAVGASGMAENFGETSTQGSIMINVSGSKNSKISVADKDGNILAEHTAKKSFGSVVISAPGIGNEGDYVVTVGESSQTVTMSGYIYGNDGMGMGMGMGFGFGNGNGMGGFGGGMKPNDIPDDFNGEVPELPDDFNGEMPDGMPDGKPDGMPGGNPAGDSFGGNN